MIIPPVVKVLKWLAHSHCNLQLRCVHYTAINAFSSLTSSCDKMEFILAIHTSTFSIESIILINLSSGRPEVHFCEGWIITERDCLSAGLKLFGGRLKKNKVQLREDAHRNSVFYSGWTTKVWVPPPLRP